MYGIDAVITGPELTLVWVLESVLWRHAHQRHLWSYRTYTTTLQYTCYTQTENYFTSTITNAKDKDKPEDRQGAVYKIKCCDCRASYIGETSRNLSTQMTEHKRATRNGVVSNHIAEHHLQTKHQIDWDSATFNTYSTDYYQGHPTAIFGKMSVGKTIWDLEFSEHLL